MTAKAEKALISITERVAKADPIDQAFLLGYLEGAANQKEKAAKENGDDVSPESGKEQEVLECVGSE